jgi:D-xylose reductase
MALQVPPIGLGTWKISKAETAGVVYNAISAGVRVFDCACDYGNEKEVGEGLRKAIDEGLIARGDLFITSKLWNTYHAKEHVELAARKSLQDLGLDYFDLYLVHFPIAQKFVDFETRYPPEWIHDPTGPNPRIELSGVSYKETWTAMEELKSSGVAKHIGVCNLNVQALTEIFSYCQIRPENLQIELHPYLTQAALVAFCKREGVSVTAFSPLGASSYIELNMATNVGALEEAVVKDLAAKYKATPAQIVLAWNLHRGVSVIPKSSSLERIKENWKAVDLKLAEEDFAAISALNQRRRFNDPGVFCVGMGGSIPIFD